MRTVFIGVVAITTACTGGKHYANVDAGDDISDATMTDGTSTDAACGDLCDAYCLRGTLTVISAPDTVNGNPSTMAFKHLIQTPTNYNLVFDVMSSYTTVSDGSQFPQGQLRVLVVRMRKFSFVDSFMNNTYGAAFAGMNYDRIALVNGPMPGISMGNIASPTASQYWGWEAMGTPAGIKVAQDGFPILAPTTADGSGSGATGVILRRYQTGTPQMTDFAQSNWTVKIAAGADCM